VDWPNVSMKAQDSSRPTYKTPKLRFGESNRFLPVLPKKIGPKFLSCIRERIVPGSSSTNAGERPARSPGGSGCGPGWSVTRRPARRSSQLPEE
jgi:hypothetical protein